MFADPARRRPDRRAAATAAVTLTVVVAGFALARPCRALAAPGWMPHRVVVGYRTPVRPTAASAASAAGRAAGARAAAGIGNRPGARSGVSPAHTVRLPAGESVRAALARLRRRADVAYAQPDWIAHAAGGFYPDDRGRGSSAKGWVKSQWNLLAPSGIDAPQAWANLLRDRHPGGRGVTIAVLDTGVAYRDWKRYRRSPDFSHTRFVSPYDFVAHNRYPLDRNGHGTFVAGVLAESTNNHVGLTGIAYGASIMPVRVLDADGEGDAGTIARGIRYAVDRGADIVNLSLEFLPSQVGSASAIPQIVSAIGYARRHGVMVVGASGNDETRRIAYPARTPGVVAVGATTKDRCLANYSNGGPGLALVAPGGGTDAIMSHDRDCHPERTLPAVFQLTLDDPPHWASFGYPGSYIGTSIAAPEVAGAAALVIASHVLGPHPTPNQVLARLQQTATPLPAGGRRPNDLYGYGLLDAGAATAPLSASARRRR